MNDTRQPSVKKSVCERYDVRDGRSGWAVIMLDERGGMLSIQSDYGTYGYHWGNHGCKSLKHFLTQIDDSYLIGKLTMGMADAVEFDGDETLERFQKRAKELIIEKRRERSFFMVAEDRYTAKGAFRASTSERKFEKLAARQCWDEMEELGTPHSADDFIHSLAHFGGLNALFPAPWEDPGITYVTNRQCTMFIERLWPLFIAEIKREIQAEAADADGAADVPVPERARAVPDRARGGAEQAPGGPGPAPPALQPAGPGGDGEEQDV